MNRTPVRRRVHATHSRGALTRDDRASRMGLFIILAVVFIAVVLVLVFFLGSRNFEEQTSAEDASERTALSRGGALDAVAFEVSDDERSALERILGAELATKLVDAAVLDGDANWIATHPEAFSVDGESVQFKLLRLAAIEPEAVSFVRAWPDAYPQKTGEACEAPVEGEVPHLYQWDPRWGYTVYSGTTFALTGCCPTAMTMVYQGLTGKADISPYDMGVLARDNGFMTDDAGTDAGLLFYASSHLGLDCEERMVSSETLLSALKKGELVILNVRPGDFTEIGHYIVACGLDDNGQVIVNDPFSVEHSKVHWSANRLIGQTISLYAFHRA